MSEASPGAPCTWSAPGGRGPHTQQSSGESAHWFALTPAWLHRAGGMCYVHPVRGKQKKYVMIKKCWQTIVYTSLEVNFREFSVKNIFWDKHILKYEIWIIIKFWSFTKKNDQLFTETLIFRTYLIIIKLPVSTLYLIKTVWLVWEHTKQRQNLVWKNCQCQP